MHAFRKRLVIAVVAAAIAAPAAAVAADSGSPTVHAQIDRTGSVHVSGYDGGVSLTNAKP